MEVIVTDIPDVKIVVPDVFRDARGYFTETYSEERYVKAGITARFVQDNESCSSRGVLRGLHWQAGKHAQAKLVRVIRGAVWDVAVDIRKGSPTYGKWTARELSEENHAMLWVPPGFAHGFAVLSETAHFTYKCTNVYAPQAEANCRWNDPDLAIAWPLEGLEPCTSPKDNAAPRFHDIEPL